MILSFDISTTCIGWCLLEDDGVFVDIGYIQLSKEKNFYKKSRIFKNWFESYWRFHNLGEIEIKIFVEEPLKAFKGGESMAQVIALLQAFNAVCRYIINSFTGIEPEMIMESSARKLVNIKVPRGVKKKEKKQFVFNFVKNLNIIPEETWKYKKTGTPKDWCYDMTDAFVIAYAGVKRNG